MLRRLTPLVVASMFALSPGAGHAAEYEVSLAVGASAGVNSSLLDTHPALEALIKDGVASLSACTVSAGPDTVSVRMSAWPAGRIQATEAFGEGWERNADSKLSRRTRRGLGEAQVAVHFGGVAPGDEVMASCPFDAGHAVALRLTFTEDGGGQ